MDPASSNEPAGIQKGHRVALFLIAVVAFATLVFGILVLASH
jgi:hypothetical protein